MSEDSVIDECLRSIAKIHDKSLVEIRSLFIRGKVQTWGTNPYSLGAFVGANPHHASFSNFGSSIK